MPLLRSMREMATNRIEPKARLCFLHVAKCGGISINQALRKKYLFSYTRLNAKASLEAARSIYGFDDPYADHYEPVLRFRENILLYELEKGSGFISGHYAFSSKAFEKHQGRYKFMTILRDPVARFLSFFFFNSSKPEDSPFKVRGNLEELVESEAGRRMGHSLVTLIGGVREDGRYGSKEALRQARENLERFDICGAIEDTGSIARQLEKECGLRVRIGRRNQSPVKSAERKRIVTDDIRARMEEICEHDRILYDDAVRLSAARSGEPAPEQRQEFECQKTL